MDSWVVIPELGTKEELMQLVKLADAAPYHRTKQSNLSFKRDLQDYPRYLIRQEGVSALTRKVYSKVYTIREFKRLFNKNTWLKELT